MIYKPASGLFSSLESLPVCRSKCRNRCSPPSAVPHRTASEIEVRHLGFSAKCFMPLILPVRRSLWWFLRRMMFVTTPVRNNCSGFRQLFTPPPTSSARFSRCLTSWSSTVRQTWRTINMDEQLACCLFFFLPLSNGVTYFCQGQARAFNTSAARRRPTSADSLADCFLCNHLQRSNWYSGYPSLLWADIHTSIPAPAILLTVLCVCINH